MTYDLVINVKKQFLFLPYLNFLSTYGRNRNYQTHVLHENDLQDLCTTKMVYIYFILSNVTLVIMIFLLKNMAKNYAGYMLHLILEYEPSNHSKNHLL